MLDARRTVRIQATHGWRALDLVELWQYRELVLLLAWRDVQVRYKQTALGVAWALLQPLLAMTIFAIVFGSLIRVPSDGVPFALFAYIGLLPWTYVSNAISNASSSLVGNTTLISRVYFPRLVIPLASVLSGLVDLGIGFVLLLILLGVFGFPPTQAWILVVPLIVLAVIAAFGVSVWLSSLDVQYRDVRYAVPFLIQVWLFGTPVVYPSSIIPEQFRVIYALNPMAGIVEGLRWALLGNTRPPHDLLAVGFGVIVLVLASGLLYFRRMERTFADLI